MVVVNPYMVGPLGKTRDVLAVETFKWGPHSSNPTINSKELFGKKDVPSLVFQIASEKIMLGRFFGCTNYLLTRCLEA